MQDEIIIKGAREHNLKNISLKLPRNKMIVFTGLSGSGKSSLAFDTIFAEGQRRYIESLSAYARQFLGRLNKPDVDEIEGLSPAISIDQKCHSANPRSTVATITEIYDYLRVLFARTGKPHCPKCGKEIRKMTSEEIVDTAVGLYTKRKSDKNVVILAPAVRGRKGEYYQLLYDFLNAGFSEVRIDGTYYSLRDRIELSRYKRHTIELVVDRLPSGLDMPASARPEPASAVGSTKSAFGQTKSARQRPVKGPMTRDSCRSGSPPKADAPREHASGGKDKDNRLRLAEAVEAALKYGNDVVTIIADGEISLSAKFTCPNDSFSFPEIEPRLFSFNSPYGACEECGGLGTEHAWSEKICPACLGKRLKKEALSVLIGGKNIAAVTALQMHCSFSPN